VRLEGLGALKKISDLIGNQTRDLRASIIEPQPSIIQLILQVINTTINKKNGAYYTLTVIVMKYVLLRTVALTFHRSLPFIPLRSNYVTLTFSLQFTSLYLTSLHVITDHTRTSKEFIRKCISFTNI
jgi:hypothetical protein